MFSCKHMGGRLLIRSNRCDGRSLIFLRFSPWGSMFLQRRTCLLLTDLVYCNCEALATVLLRPYSPYQSSCQTSGSEPRQSHTLLFGMFEQHWCRSCFCIVDTIVVLQVLPLHAIVKPSKHLAVVLPLRWNGLCAEIFAEQTFLFQRCKPVEIFVEQRLYICFCICLHDCFLLFLISSNKRRRALESSVATDRSSIPRR